MKLASERLLYHLLTQFLPGFDHQGEWLGSPLLDTRLLPARADGLDEQDASRHPGARHAEPPQRIQEADAFHREVLQRGQCQKTTAKTISSLSVPVPVLQRSTSICMPVLNRASEVSTWQRCRSQRPTTSRGVGDPRRELTIVCPRATASRPKVIVAVVAAVAATGMLMPDPSARSG